MEFKFVNNSVLSLNNHFYKVFKRLIEKKAKDEPHSDEIEWISNQLLHENRKISENSVIVLVQFGRSHDLAVALNALIAALSIASCSNFDLIANGIFKLLQNVNNPFGITEKPHPAILLISESSEKMLYLSQKIEEIIKDSR